MMMNKEMMMNDKQLILENEMAKGAEMKVAYENYIKPFVDEKREVLFEAFSQTLATEPDVLVNIRMQISAINALEADYLSYISTGKLARFALEKGE